MKVAVVHEWLVTYAGSERVVEEILRLFPEADLFCLVDFLPQEQRGFLEGRSVHTSGVQRLPFARRLYRHYLPFMMLAVEQFDLGNYDIVISSNHAVAKGVITGPDQLHISYVHSPMRYAWDLQHVYLREAGLQRGLKSYLARGMLHWARMWDLRTANGVDGFIANSRFVARRIRKIYRRDSHVIAPPVDIHTFRQRDAKEDFYLTVSRMVPYKRVDLVVEAFAAMPDRKLVVIGDGPEFEKVKSKAAPNVELLGYQETEILRDYMQRARAFVFAALEDFGIITVEAQASGTPVIAYGRGGSCDIVRPLGTDHPTGVFFMSQTQEAIVSAVHAFEQNCDSFTADACRANAERFSAARFREKLSGYIGEMRSYLQNELAQPPTTGRLSPNRNGLTIDAS